MKPTFSNYLPVCVALSLSVFSAARSQPIDGTDSERDRSTANYPTYGTWHSSRIRGGGYFQNIVLCASDPNRCYTFVDMAGIYRSDDRGNTWRMLNAFFGNNQSLLDTRGIDADPRNADCFVAALGTQNDTKDGGIYRTEDGGKTFTRVLSAIFGGNSMHRSAGQILVRSPHDPDVILAGSYYTGLFRSQDNGKTWKSVGVLERWPTDIRFDKVDPNRIFLCAQTFKGNIGGVRRELSEALYRSTDAGQTWQQISNNSPTEMIQDPNDPKRFFGIFEYKTVRTTTDFGETWQPMVEGLPQEPSADNDWTSRFKFTALAAGPDFIVVANANGDMWRLDRGQSRWRTIARQSVDAGDWWGNGGSKPGYVHFGKALGSVIIDPRDSNHWFSTDWFAIWQSHDAGRNWKLAVDGAEPTYIFALAADPTAPGIVHMGMSDNGYFRSTDGGKSFRQHTNGISSDIKNVEVCLSNPRHLYAVGGSLTGRVIKWGVNQVYTSVDAGQSWRASPQQGLPDNKTFRWNTIITNPIDENHVFLAVSGKPTADAGGVYESRDGGTSWAWIGAGLPTDKDNFFRESIWTVGREIAVDSSGSMVALSSDRRLVYRFDQQKKQWAKSLDLHGMPFEIAANPQKPGVFLVSSTGDGVFLTTDGGLNWQLTYKGSAGRIGWDVIGGQRAAVSTGNGMILTRDGGKTWEMLDQSLPERRLHNMATFAGNRLIIGSGASGVFWTDLN